MKIKSFLSLLLCILLLLPAIAGCKPTDENLNDDSEMSSEVQSDREDISEDQSASEDSSEDASEEISEETTEKVETEAETETETETEANTETETESDIDGDFLEIVKNGISVDVVFPKRSSSAILAFVNDLTDTLHKLGCTDVNAITEEENYDPNKVEIVIGNTVYTESQAVFNSLSYGQGTICVNGNKLIIAANDDDVYATLSPKLALAIKTAKDDQGNVSISRDYSMTTSKNLFVSTIPVLDGLPLYDVKDGGDSSYVLTFRDATVDVLNGYINTLKQNGYEEYTKNTIEKNIYYTFVNDSQIITLALTDYNKELKVIAEKSSGKSLPKKETENVWSPVEGMTTTITQIGLFSENVSGEARYNGLSFVIRLADGSFIVVDGGHDYGNDHDKLYKVLEKQSEGRDIIIAAWFFTHDHGDHTGFFTSFCEKFASKVSVERFIYNFPAVTDVKNGTGKVGGNIRVNFRNSEIIKAHPGQKFFIRNAKINVLYTNDLWEHKKQTLKTHNEASTVFTVELEGKKLIILGDYYDDRGILRNLYTAETLKSDIMQVSHHGISNCGSLLYPIIAPEWALWPLGDDHWISQTEDRYISEHPINAYMKSMDQNKVFMAKDDIVILTVKDGNITSQIFENDAIHLAS